MKAEPVPFWKEAPFLRLLVPFTAGIAVQWRLQVSLLLPLFLFVSAFSVLLFLATRRLWTRFHWSLLQGVALHILLFSAGALLCVAKDVRHRAGAITGMDMRTGWLLVTLQEPLSRKPASWKATAQVDGIWQSGRCQSATGNLLVYFDARNVPGGVGYGSRLLIRKTPERIRNTGNPGGFDYEQFCAFQQVYHQVFLREGDYHVLPGRGGTFFRGWLFSLRDRIVAVLRTWVGRQESGLAEALLIGYKDDLDKELVQSYANTGVVHIIAISGMHLGLIYWVLTRLFFFLRRVKLRWLEPVMVIACLWIFSLLTGGSASVMRSAVMFTCLVAGQYFRKQGSAFNSLGASAFLLLCYDPFWLWDAGFQLSYGAVLSIMLFMQPLYRAIPAENPLLDAGAKMLATTLAAQVLTVPVGIFLFHQFPLYFPVTNLVAIPLSSGIVLAEIVLCAASRVPGVGTLSGALVSGAIRLMNGFVAAMEHLPLSSWNGLQISVLQAGLLYAMIVTAVCWLWQRQPRWVAHTLLLLVFFMGARAWSFLQCRKQQRLIVYNIPKHRAVQLVSGQTALLFTDPGLWQTPAIARNVLTPAATVQRIMQQQVVREQAPVQACYVGNKRLLMLTGEVKALEGDTHRADVLIVSGNPTLRMEEVLAAWHPARVVFDASNAAFRVRRWAEACRKAGVDTHVVAEKGAFVLNLD